MAKEYLDKAGLTYLWGKLKELFLGKTDDAYRASSIPHGEIDATSTSTAFTATVSGITELRDGVAVILHNGVVNCAAGITLDINGLGAKSIYSSYTADPISTAFQVDKEYLFIYSTSFTASGCWVMQTGYYVSDNDYRAYRVYRKNGGFKAKADFGRYRILLPYDDDYLLPTTSVLSSTKTGKALTTEEFDPFGQIYFYYHTNAVDAEDTIIATCLYYKVENLDLRYSFNIASNEFTAHKPVYIVADLQSNGKAKLATDPIAQDLPTTENTHIYISLGRAYNGYCIELDPHHPVYKWVNGKMRQITQDALTVNGHTVNSDVPANLSTDLESAVNVSSSAYTTASAAIDAAAAAGQSAANAMSAVETLFKIKTYTYAYSNIATGGSLNVTATNLGMSTPTGYTPIAAQQVSSGNGNVIARTWDVTATGSTAAVALRNVATSAQSGTVTFKVVYVRSDSITT